MTLALDYSLFWFFFYQHFLDLYFRFNFYFHSERFDTRTFYLKCGCQVGKVKNESLFKCKTYIVFVEKDDDEPLLHMKWVKLFHNSNLDIDYPGP